MGKVRIAESTGGGTNIPDGASGVEPTLDAKGRTVVTGVGGGGSSDASAANQITGNASLASILAAFAGRLLTDAGPWAYGDPVTPSDTVDIPNSPARGLRIVAAGVVKYEIMRSDGVTRYQVTETFAAGSVLPFAVYRVYATGTTSTSVLAGF